MADSQYKISLGIDLDTSNLSEKINAVSNANKTPIKLDIELEPKNLQKQIDNIQKQIQGLNNIKVNLGTGTSSSSGLNGLSKSFDNDINKIKSSAKVSTDVIKNMRDTLSSMKFDNSSIDNVIKDLNEMNVTISNVSAKLNGNKLNVTVKGIDELDRAITVVRQFDTEAGDITTLGTTISQSFDKIANATKKINTSLKDNTFSNQIDKMKSDANKLSSISDELRIGMEQVEKSFNDMKIASSNDNTEELISANERYEKALKDVKNQLDINKRAQKEYADGLSLQHKKDKLLLDIEKYKQTNSRALKDYGSQIDSIAGKISSCDDIKFNNLNNEWVKLKGNIEIANKTGLSFGDSIKNQISKYSKYLSVATVAMYSVQGLKDMFNQVVAIDSAMTELKKVTDETYASYNKFLSNASKKAKDIGTTIDGLVGSTADFARLGYSFTDSQGLAEVANIYAVVGDEIEGVEGATKSLISTMAAFKSEANGMSNTDFAMDIVDKMNEVSNNYAISSGGIGQALERSASSLEAAGNTLDESIALITAANEVVQNPDKVGNAFKTIGMRIRGAKTELEEMGEDTSGMVESTAKLRQEIIALSGVDIMKDKNIFKSTYQIMDELSTKWKDLTDIQQASITELVAGKHQGNIMSSLMQNFDTARDALNTSLGASGSAMAEHAKWSQSLEARLLKLKATWQSLAQSFMSSDFLKFALDRVIDLVNVVDKLIDTLGVFGTIAGGFSLFKGFKFVKSDLKGFKSLFSVMNDGLGAMETFKSGVSSVGQSLKSFIKTPAGVASAIGLAITAFSLAYNTIKNYKEEQSELRKEVISSSDAFLKSASTFEQAYIKYSGKTNLTSDEEEELANAINGTVTALNDKSSSLQKVVDNSSSYIDSLETIAEAERKEAERKAKEKNKASEKELKETAKGWFAFDGSEIDIDIGIKDDDSKTQKLAKEVGEKFYGTIESVRGDFETVKLTLDPNASADEIVNYYDMLVEYKNKLVDSDLTDSTVYEDVNKQIEKLTDTVKTYKDSLYDVAKAGYKIPKTLDEFLEMRQGILEGLNGDFDYKNEIANRLDKEYGQVFDLSSVEAQAKKFINVIDGFGNKESKTVEMLLNMRTAVNNGECTVGDYISQFNEVEDTIDNFNEEEQKELKLAYGLDTDNVKKQYDDLLKTLTKTMNEDSAKKFLDGMSASELSATFSLKGEIDWENGNPKEIRDFIEKEAKLNEAISFELNLETKVANLESIGTAISESISGTGLGTDSVNAIEGIFGDLDSYDQSKLFERTANGIRLNSDELRKLNDEYVNTDLKGLNDKMNALGERYNQTREELYDLTYGTDEYKKKASELEGIEAQINANEKLMSQYEGLASAYQTWQRTENSGSQRDMYESIIEGFKNVDDEISRGWLDDGSIEFLRLIKGDTLSATASTEELKNAYKSLGKTIKNTTYSVRDFFTVDKDGNSTNTGVYNFLDAINQLEKEKFGGKNVVKKENGKITAFDFKVVGGDEAIAEALGISEELVQIMVRAADDAGFVVSMDGTYQQLDIVKEKAQEAGELLNNIFEKNGKKRIDIDFNTSSVKDIDNQLKSIMDIFGKEDGSINMELEGAEEALTVVSTLTTMKDKLNEPTYMKLEASQVEKDIQKPLLKLQEYERLTQTEHQLKLSGADTSELEKDKNKILDYFESLEPDVKAQLDIENLSRDEIEKKLEDGELKIPAKIDIQMEMNDNLSILANKALLDSGIIDEEEYKKRVDIILDADVDESDVIDKIIDSIDNAGITDEKEVEVAIDFLTDTKDIEKYTPEQIEIVAKYVKDVSDVDSYTPEEKQAICKFIVNNNDVLNYTPEEKVAIAKYLADPQDVDSYAPEDKEAIAKFIAEHGDVDSYIPSDREAIATFLLNNALVEGYKPTAKEQEVISKLNSSEVDEYKPPSKTMTVWATIKKRASSLWDKLTGSGGVDGTARVDGTAFANGTTSSISKSGRAFKQGNWGTKDSGVALGGEEAPELLVRNGRWHLIGEKGAEFFGYKKGDIIFNGDQTREIFEKGKIAHGNGRGKSLHTGTAFLEGTAFYGGSAGDGGIGKVDGKPVSGKKQSSSNKKSSSKSKSSKDSKEEKEFKETIDWIEKAIDRIERAIDQLDTKANSIYRTWSERNNNLVSEISKVSDEISLQQRAYDRYIKEANSAGLSSSLAEKVRNGKVDIETIKDEDLAEKIKSYQEWYEKALDCKDAILELQETESKLYQQRFDNVSAQYEGILGVIEHEKNMLEEYMNQSEAQGWLTSAKYYDALAKNENDNIAELKKQKASMLSELQTAVDSGTIKKNSEAWYQMCGEIDEATLAITEGETKLLEYQQTLQQLSWETFDLLQDKISSVTEETDFLIELLSSDKLYDDKGRLTNDGSATMGLHGQNYNSYMYQADKYGAEAERLKKELEKDPFDTELEERYREMISLQQEHILKAQDEKEAIRDMVSEGIELELDALQELIDKKNEQLESERDLYEYSKKVKEQTEEIASLEKQMSAYSGDNSEEAQQKIQKIKLDLENAKEALAESEYDKYISDQQSMLDELYTQYEEILNTRLDNLDALVSDMIVEINNNASIIGDTIRESADSVGYTLSDSMKMVWIESSNGTNTVITTYGEKFATLQTTTNNALNTINVNLQNMINQLNTIAKTKVESSKTSSATKQPQAGGSNKPSTPAPPKKPAPSPAPPQKTISVGGKINAGSAQIYDYAGDKSGERQYFRKDPIYKVLKTDGNWLQVRWHKLTSGITGWFKKGDVKAYETGKRRISNNEMAWTQEKGTEFIVRPSDGAILTPVAKKDTILNANATNNIWNMANSPTEFIKDNLNLGVANVPNSSSNNNSYVQNLDKVVFNLPNVRNYDEILSAMQKDKNFERLILSMSIDRLAGKSSLAKGKSIR